MVPAVGLLQIADGDPQVTLGRGERLVAEHFLDVAQVRAVLQEMRGAGVPPEVRRDFLFHGRRIGVALDDVGWYGPFKSSPSELVGRSWAFSGRVSGKLH